MTKNLETSTLELLLDTVLENVVGGVGGGGGGDGGEVGDGEVGCGGFGDGTPYPTRPVYDDEV